MFAQRFKRALLVFSSLSIALATVWHLLPGSLRGSIQPTVHAASFVVSTADDHDDGTCNADCTLREAINAANAAGGADTISFNIPGGGIQTINLTAVLASITGPAT